MTSEEVNTPIALNGLEDAHYEKIKDIHFTYLPGFAQFLLENKLDEYSRENLRISQEVDLPLLRLFVSFSQDQLLELSRESVKNGLMFLAENQAGKLIESSISRWVNNDLPVISKDAVVAEDIILGNYVRRKIMTSFVHFYTNDVHIAQNIIEEINYLTTEHERLSLNILINRKQELFKQAQALGRIGNWIWDLKNNKLIWSEELYRIYELDPNTEIDREKIGRFNHPDDNEFVLRQMKQSLETYKAQDFYYRIRLNDGREKVLHARGQVLLDIDRKPAQFFGTLQDVTQQKMYEKELTEKQIFIQKIADVTPSLVAAYNVKTGQYIFVNNAVKKLLGYEPEAVLEQGVQFFVDRVHPDDLESLMKKNQEALEKANRSDHPDDNDIIVEFEYRLRNQYGQYRWFHTYGTIFSRDSLGEVEYVLNISVDVTDESLLKQQYHEEKILAEQRTEEFRRSEERYHRMITEIQDYAILLLDKDGTVLNWNLGAENIKGYKSEDIVGKNFRIFYTQEDLKNKKPERLISQAIETGRASDEGWRVRKDGSRLWASVVITALHDDQNNIIGFSKVTRDLTERKITEEKMLRYADELERKNEELVRTNKELESFTYIASHDLQEPLRKIQIFSNAVLSQEIDNLSEKGKEYFNRMFSAAQRMQQLIEDLLAFSRATNVKEGFENVDLNALLNEVITGSAFAIDESAIVIDSDNLPIARVIPFQFKQVFQNLISNSIKYSKPDTPLVIKINAETITARNTTGLTKGKKYYKFSVTDNGIGFEQEHADRIFELFQRLHSKQDYPGTGIGLAICKKIIQNHNGLIRAKGKPGKGATFEIFIPAE